MDTFGDGKVLLCLLVCLAVSLASSSELPKAGYDYKTASAPSAGLNTILKAVLVHESTGHGLHGGSVSGQNDGHRIAVMKQGAHKVQPNANAGYSYAGTQPMHRQQQQREMKNIRVFHKSLGATGNIRPPGFGNPQVQVVKVIRDYVPQQRLGSFNAIKREFSVAGANPSQSLRYIHETALARPSFFLPTVVPPEGAKPGYNYGNSQQNPSNGYQYSQPSNQGLQFSSNQGSNGPSGYQYENAGQSLQASNSQPPNGYSQPVQSAAPQMVFNPRPSYRLESPRNQGYSYQSPASTPTGDAEQIAISHYVSSAVQPVNQGYRYENPQQAQSGVPQSIEPVKSNSDGYQYSNSEPQVSIPSVSQLAQGPAEAENVGYHYDRPQKSFDYDKPAVTKSTFKGQSYLPLPPVGSDRDYDRPQGAHSDGYTYQRPNPSDRPKSVFKGPSYLPLPPASGGW